MTEDNREGVDGRVAGDAGRRIAGDLSAYTTLTADFYRGEIDRMTTWRSRLDQTTNWAVVVVAAILTWAFSSADNPHYVLLIGVFAATGFLLMEANRYREYDVWRDRVRLLQSELYASMYEAEGPPDDAWEHRLSEELRRPTFDISFREALTHRLRRSYLPLLLLLLVAWVVRITVFESGEPWEQSASIFMVPGEVIVGVVGAFYAAVIVIAVLSAHDGRTEEFQS